MTSLKKKFKIGGCPFGDGSFLDIPRFKKNLQKYNKCDKITSNKKIDIE